MAKFTLKKAVVKVTDEEGNSFSVRGLSLNDIAQLLDLHKPVMEQMFNQFAASDMATMTPESIAENASEIAMGLVSQAPAMVAHCIALAADDLESYKDYVGLPVGVQLDAMVDIGTLTFETVGGAKKLLDLLKPMLVAKGRSLQNASTLTPGIGD